jgi:NAD(P)H-dependent FMN reductase
MILALSTSQAPTSLNHRGLKLLSCKFDRIDCLSKYNIPVVNVNGMDADIPKDVTAVFDMMSKFNKFVFAIPEFTGMMSSSTKNLLDWAVVISNMNLDHGKGYPWTDKHVILLTFTPSGEEGGNRHMPQTKTIFEKLGANVVYTDVSNYGWKHVIPNNQEHFKALSDKINNYLLYKSDNKDYFKNEYNNWSDKWK